MHAVPASKGGRGKKGGLSAYAKAVGKSKQTVSDNYLAGEVIANCPVDRTVLKLFLDKTAHLTAIHRADPSFWPALCQQLLAALEKEFAKQAKQSQKKAAGGDRRSKAARKDQGGASCATLKRDNSKRTVARAAAAVGMKPRTFEKARRKAEATTRCNHLRC